MKLGRTEKEKDEDGGKGKEKLAWGKIQEKTTKKSQIISCRTRGHLIFQSLSCQKQVPHQRERIRSVEKTFLLGMKLWSLWASFWPRVILVLCLISSSSSSREWSEERRDLKSRLDRKKCNEHFASLTWNSLESQEADLTDAVDDSSMSHVSNTFTFH